MAAVTQKINNYLGGVSKQTDKKKLPGQVRDCINAFPDPTFGLRKRPGLKFIKTLHTSADPDSPDFADNKWFFIKRDDEQKYIGSISNTGVRVWNSAGIECTVHDDTYTLTVTANGTSAATTQRNLPVTNVSSSGSGMTVNVVAVSGVITEVYVCTQGTGYAASDTLKVAAADSTAAADIAFTLTTKPANHYLNTTRDNYHLITVQDTTIITNTQRTVAAKTTPSYTLDTFGRVIIKHIDYQSVYNVKITVGSTTYDAGTKDGGAGGSSLHPYLTRNDDSYTAGAATFQKLCVDDVLTELKTRLDALNSDITEGTLTVTKLDASLELELKNSGTPVAFKLEAIDDRGGANMIAYNDQVSIIADAPAQCIHGRVIKISADPDSGGTAYWTKFVADDGVKGRGYWEETVDPQVSTGMDQTTLPHELKAINATTFQLQPGVWTGRDVGDLVTNSDPSFVGSTIQQTFFHNNRFGILTDDNVSMSQASDFFNFYYTSALTTTDSDPIDINCSSIRPATLHAIIPTAQGLVLFSKHEQFMLFADAKILTPSSAIIRGISNYEMDSNIDPVDVGTNVTFVSKTPSYTRIFNMITRGSDESPMVEDIGKVVSEWVPDTVNNLITSPQNSLIALFGTTDNAMYLYKTYAVGEKRLMQSWVKWILPGNVQNATVDSDTMWTVLEYSGKYVLAKASLTQTPEDEIVVNSDGQQVNPHMDLYGAVSSMTYDSTNDLTKCYLPTGYRDNEDLTPVLVIAGNGTTNFAGVTESGFTLAPDRPTGQTHATASPYFEVPGKDISGLTAADVIVGYKYNYDVELPRTYFKQNPEGTIVDYTASLIISRMKFAVGLSSVCGFKVKITGRKSPTEEYTGVGTTMSSTLVANGTGAGPEGDHTVENLATTTSGSGTGMTVDVTMSGGVATAVSVNTEGTGYAVGNTVTIANTLTLTTAAVTATIATIGQTDFPFNLDYEDTLDLKVKINGVANTGFSIVNDTDRDERKLLQFTTPPGEGDTILLYTDNWYTIQPVQDANQYLADDVPLTEETVFTLPIHQRSENFNVRVFSNSPFPVSLSSMMWEGQYSPRFYRRT